MKRHLRRLVALALGAVALTSCGTTDQPTAPLRVEQAIAPVSPSNDLLGRSTSLVLMNGLQRTTPLSAPITVSKSIGVDGGTLAIAAAGVTVIIPKGALTKTTTITMTARAGPLVAYNFAPHGIVFAKPLVFTQALKGTNASLLNAPLLRLGHYADESLLTKTDAPVTELLGGVVDTLSWTFTSLISHFSGYIVTCGRRGG